MELEHIVSNNQFYKNGLAPRNAKALKCTLVADEGTRRLRYRSLKEPLVLHLAQEAEADCRSADDNLSFTAINFWRLILYFW